MDAVINEDPDVETGGEGGALSLLPYGEESVELRIELHGQDTQRLLLGMTRAHLENARRELANRLRRHGEQGFVDFARARQDGLSAVSEFFTALLDVGPSRHVDAATDIVEVEKDRRSVGDLLKDGLGALYALHPATDRIPAFGLRVRDAYFLPLELLDVRLSDDVGPLTLGEIAAIHRVVQSPDEPAAPAMGPVFVDADLGPTLFLAGSENSSNTRAEAAAINRLKPRLTVWNVCAHSDATRADFQRPAAAFVRGHGTFLYLMGHNAPEEAHGAGFALELAPHLSLLLQDFLSVWRSAARTPMWPITILSTCRGNSPDAMIVGITTPLLRVGAAGVIAATHDLHDRTSALVGPTMLEEIIGAGRLPGARADVSAALYRLRRRARCEAVLVEARARLVTDALMVFSRDQHVAIEWRRAVAQPVEPLEEDGDGAHGERVAVASNDFPNPSEKMEPA